MKKIAIDQGYSSVKLNYEGQLYKFPTAISFANDLGVAYGEEEVFDYEGQKYYVGDQAVSNESFSTGDYGFKKKFDPLLLFSVLRKLDLIKEAKQNNLELFLTLSLADWKHKDEYLKIFEKFTINGITLGFKNITLMPQGAGAYMDFVVNHNNGEHPSSAVILDIGAVTINTLRYEDGKPQRAHSKGFPGHGVMISIIQPFASFLETQFSMPFSNAEAMKIFTSGKFVFNGIEQPQISEKILELKGQFVHKLFNSVLTSEKKQLATAEKVIFAGGGCYLLEGIKFAANTTMASKPYEFANVAVVV
jgi:hypothetical protein